MPDDPLARATAVAVDYLAGIVLLIALGALWSWDVAYAVSLGLFIVVFGVMVLTRSLFR